MNKNFKKLGLVLFLIVFLVLFSSQVFAGTDILFIEDTEKNLEEGVTSLTNYGTYELTKTRWYDLFGWLDEKVKEVSLESNTDVCVNCLASGKITLLEKGKLVDDILFKRSFDDMKSWTDWNNFVYWDFYVENKNRYHEEEYTKLVCENITETKEESCREVLVTRVVDNGEWVSLDNFEIEFEPDVYNWKLVGRKKAGVTYDWIIKTEGVLLTNWAVWGAIGDPGVTAEVNLLSPEDAINISEPDVTFIANTTLLNESVYLVNASLWTNESGLWDVVNTTTDTIMFPVTDIVSYSKFDETAGTNAVDSVAGVYNGTLTNGATWAPGKINNSVTFDGTNDFVLFPVGLQTYVHPNENFTLSFWFNADVTNDNDFLLSSRYGVSDNFAIKLKDNVLSAVYYDGVQDNDFIASTAFSSTGTWTHFVMTYQENAVSDNLRLYVNNVEAIGNTYNGGSGNDGIALGGGVGGTNPFDGEIDEFGVWSRVLTSNEITELYNSGDGLEYLASIENITFTQTYVPGDSVLWNIQACDSDGDCGFATSNRSFRIESSPPIIVSNLTQNIIYNYGDNVTLNYNITSEGVLDSCWYNYNDTNTSLNCLENIVNITSVSGFVNITIYANDTIGNQNNSLLNFSFDSIPPELSATNSSNETYNYLRNATVIVSDINLLETRYVWNNNTLNVLCSAGGNTTTNGTVLNPFKGNNTLYLCARDTIGNVVTWNGTYNWYASPPTVTINSNNSFNEYGNLKSPFTSTNMSINLTVNAQLGDIIEEYVLNFSKDGVEYKSYTNTSILDNEFSIEDEFIIIGEVPGSPIVDNLISYWKFEEGVGTTAYDSHGTKDATLNNVGWGDGISGGGLNFVSGTRYVTTMNRNLQAPVSYNIWFNTTTETDQFILWHRGTTYTYIKILSDGRIRIKFRYGTTYTTIQDGYNDGEWHMVTLTYDGSTPKLYVDGVFVSNVPSGPLTGLYPIRVGEGFTGQMDEIGFWSDALNITEIESIYGNGTVLRYPFQFANWTPGIYDINLTITDNFGGNYTYDYQYYVGEYFLNEENILSGNQINMSLELTTVPLIKNITQDLEIDGIDGQDVIREEFVGYYSFLHDEIYEEVRQYNYTWRVSTIMWDDSIIEDVFTGDFLVTNWSLLLLFKDEITKDLVDNETIKIFIGGEYSINTTTANGTYRFAVPYSDLYDILYSSDSYLQKQYYLNIIEVGSGENVTLYMLPKTEGTVVSAKVFDTQYKEVYGAIIKVLKYDFTDNSYFLTEVARTNFLGETTLNLVLNTEYYKFFVEYPFGTVVEETDKSIIYQDSIEFRINLDSPVSEKWIKAQGIDYNITFDESTNQFRLVYNDPNNYMSRCCLVVNRLKYSGNEYIGENCIYSPSGILYVEVDNITGATYEANAYAYFSTPPQKFASLIHIFTQVYEVLSEFGIFIIFALTIIAFFIGLSLGGAPTAMILTPLPLVLGCIISLVPIPLYVALGLEVIAVILAIMVGDRQ